MSVLSEKKPANSVHSVDELAPICVASIGSLQSVDELAPIRPKSGPVASTFNRLSVFDSDDEQVKVPEDNQMPTNLQNVPITDFIREAKPGKKLRMHKRVTKFAPRMTCSNLNCTTE